MWQVMMVMNWTSYRAPLRRTSSGLMAQEATLGVMAKGRPRRLLAPNQTFQGAQIEVCNSVPYYEQTGRSRAPEWRGPAAILGIDGSGVAANLQTFKAARFCVLKQRGPVEVGDGRSSDADQFPRAALVAGAMDSPPRRTGGAGESDSHSVRGLMSG